MKGTPEKPPEFDSETYTNPILEECYRIKAEISAKFKTQEEFFAYLKAGEEEDKRNGIMSRISIRLNTHRQKNLKTMPNHQG